MATENQEIEKRFEQRKEELLNRITEKKRDGASRLQEKHGLLLEEREAIQHLPRALTSAVGMIKEALEEGRQKYGIPFLTDHVKQVQAGHNKPLSPDTVQTGFAHDRNLWKLLYLLITPQIIDEAAGNLENSGITEKERSNRLAKIDSQIAACEADLEKILSA